MRANSPKTLITFDTEQFTDHHEVAKLLEESKTLPDKRSHCTELLD